LISTDAPEAILRIANAHDVGCLSIGVTMKERLQIDNQMVTGDVVTDRRELWIDCPVSRLREVWETALENQLAPVPV
jgi:hypothetical protein